MTYKQRILVIGSIYLLYICASNFGNCQFENEFEKTTLKSMSRSGTTTRSEFMNEKNRKLHQQMGQNGQNESEKQIENASRRGGDETGSTQHEGNEPKVNNEENEDIRQNKYSGENGLTDIISEIAKNETNKIKDSTEQENQIEESESTTIIEPGKKIHKTHEKRESTQYESQRTEEDQKTEKEQRYRDKYCAYLNIKWSLLKEFKKVHPSAVSIGAAKLKNHRIDWNVYDPNIESNSVLLVPDHGYEVWGTAYYINKNDFHNLTTGYGNSYDPDRPKEMQIELLNGKEIKCYGFTPTQIPEKLAYGEPIPLHRRPSQDQIDYAAKGLTENGAPRWYIDGIADTPIYEPRKILRENITK